MTLILIGAWFVLLCPQSLGGPARYVLVSGNSMEPTLSSLDFVVARRTSTYEVGDIVVFPVPETDGRLFVIHRLVGGNARDGFVMQGDNRSTPDIWKPTPDDIAGKLWFSIPAGGRALLVLRSPAIVALFAGLGAFLWIYLGGKDEEVSAAPPPPRLPPIPPPPPPRPVSLSS